MTLPDGEQTAQTYVKRCYQSSLLQWLLFWDSRMDKNIEKLQAATALVAFDDTLRSAANTVAYFGVLFAVFGIIFTVRFGLASSWGALAIGAARCWASRFTFGAPDLHVRFGFRG
jgi:hypothetical protein